MSTAAGPARPDRSRVGRRDRGSASVWLLGVGCLLVAAGLVGAALGAAHVARHQAQAAADLAALAGAAVAVTGEPAACARAAELVAANGARIISCRVTGLDVTVTAAVPVAGFGGVGREATTTAVAGPVRADDSS